MDNTDQAAIGNKIANLLLDIGAVRINVAQPYVWSSGWKSPIYCDNRLSLSHPEARSYIKNHLCATISSQWPDAEAIAGVATAGIPQGALVADASGLPFLYVRAKPKGHGMENLIEGKATPGQRVVVIEDLVSTGGSSLKAAEALISAGMTVVGMAAIFTYGFPQAEDNFRQSGIRLVCLAHYGHILSAALARGLVDKKTMDSLRQWRLAPSEWQGI